MPSTVTRSLPHGQVAAARGTARKIGLDRLLGPDGNRCRDLILALLIGRILDPVSKLATARMLSPATASSSLGEALGLGEVADDELYAALDWLGERQAAIETALAKRHLQNGTLVLYDVSSSYMEGSCCPLAQRGYNRDDKKGMLQIVYGLLCAADGCPVAIEVFEGNTGDPTTLGPHPVPDEFPGQFLLISLHFLWPSQANAAHFGGQSHPLFGLPQLHAGTPKCLAKHIAKVVTSAWVFCKEKALESSCSQNPPQMS
jgi:hypothetical protein